MFSLTDRSGEVRAARDAAIKTALSRMGALAAGYARQRIIEEKRVRTGRMRDSVRFALDDAAPAVIIGTDVPYAPEHELGTARIRGIHFLRDALQEHMEEYESIWKEER